MNKILIIILALMAAPALAATICADDDVIAIVLDPATAGKAGRYDKNLFEWGVDFPYGSVWGIATCMDIGGTISTAVDELRSTDGELAVGGEKKGKYCWCQVMHPAPSNWTFLTTYSSTDGCAGYCVSDCTLSVRTNPTLRGGMFGSLGKK